MNNLIDHSLLNYDEKIEILKMISLPTEPRKWTEQEGLVAHEAFELARLIKKLKATFREAA